MIDVGQFVRVVGGGKEEGRSGGGGGGREAVLLPRFQNLFNNAKSAFGAAIPPPLLQGRQ